MLQIVPFGDEPVDERERPLGRLSVNRDNQLVEYVFCHDAEKFADLRVGDMVAAVRQSLFEQREGIAQAALGCAGHHRNRAGINFEIFGFRNSLDRVGNFLERERPKLEQLRARFDRVGEILGLRRRQNENHFFRRFLERLQQGI